MTVHGIVEVKVNSLANLAQYGEMYVSLCNFLSSSQAQSIGIQRIAYNKGSGANGTGLDYPGTPNSVGNNAWSVWCWTSASIPFYALFQMTTGSQAFGTAPGNPGLSTYGIASGLYNNIAVAVAFHGNGSTGSLAGALSGTAGPWNGTTLNNGSDTKGIPVWQTGSATPPSGTLYVFPRSNSSGGTYVTNKQVCADVILPNQAAQHRFHFICDENNFLVLGDSAVDAIYAATWFGKFVPRDGYIGKPYAMITHPAEGAGTSIFGDGSYGVLAGNVAADGGIAHPNPQSFASGSLILLTGRLGELYTTTLQPNLSTNPTSYDGMNVHLFVNEVPYYGYAGYIDFFDSVFNVATHDTTATKSHVVFGMGAAAATYYKLLVPWNGVTVPGSGGTRTGSIF